MSLTKEELEATKTSVAGMSMLLTKLHTASLINHAFLKSKDSPFAGAQSNVAALTALAVTYLGAIIPDDNSEITDSLDCVKIMNTEEVLIVTNDCICTMRDTLNDKDKTEEPIEGDMRVEIVAHLDAFMNFSVPWIEEMNKLQEASAEAVKKAGRDV